MSVKKKRRLRFLPKKKKSSDSQKTSFNMSSAAGHIRLRKPKRRIRRSIVFSVTAIFVAVLLAIFVPKIVTDTRLKNLGYDDAAIKAIREEKLAKTILQNGYYSEYLNKSFHKGTVEARYLNLYAAVDADRELTATDFLLYARLEDKGYEYDQLEKLFSKLETWEITPLLVYTYQWNEDPYIEDCIACRSENSAEKFHLEGDYFPYPNVDDAGNDKTAVVENGNDTDVLINAQHRYDSSFEADTVTIDTQYAVNGVSLQDEAAEAFVSFSKAGIQAGEYFFATGGYRSYDISTIAYQSCSVSYGDYTKYNCTYPGHSEHQTGLAFNTAATYETSVDFKDSDVAKWMYEHCTEYGFIVRYPEGKKEITGVRDEPEHFRYLGKDLAKAVTESGLSYDEYYELYLADWKDDSFKPSERILKEADPLNS